MARPRKFRFGVQTTSTRSAKDWREHARKVEALGYSTLFMPDHFIDTQLAPMVAISFAAAVTEQLRIGMVVLGNDYKHPAITAKEAATIDVLSDGRLEFGLGAGWQKTDYDALDLRYDSPGTRIERLGEAISIIKSAWAPGAFEFTGKHYRIRNYDGVPKPVQRPRPPILIGGGGRRLLRLAGREADIVGINPNLRAGAVTADAVQTSLAAQTLEKVGWVREGAGERFGEIELQIRYFLAAITDNAKGFASAVAPRFGISPDDALGSGIALVGTVDSVCELLQQRREQWGVSYVVLGEDNFEAFAPVVARLAGT